MKRKLTLNNIQRSDIKLCTLGIDFPTINGDIVVGRTVVSGASSDNPSAAGFNIDIDVNTDTLTSQKLWDVEISGFVDKDDGQKVLVPAFEKGGRCFIRGRSSGVQATGEDTTNNGIMEIDPKTGAYDPLDRFEFPNSGTLPDNFDIDKEGVIYADQNGVEQVSLYDLDYNNIDNYLYNESEFGNVNFGVNSSGDIAMLGGGIDVIEYYSKDKSINFKLTDADFPNVGNQMIDVRVSNKHIYLTDTLDQIHAYNINNREVDWVRAIQNLNSISVGWDGYIYAGGGPSTEGVLYKIDPTDGTVVWNVLLFTSGNTSPNIGQVGQLSPNYLYVFANVLGSLRVIKADGTALDGSVGIGRGNVGTHPFNNFRIQNYNL